MKRKGRWAVAGALCIVTALNYLDRQTLPLLADTLAKTWGFSSQQYAYITAAWLTSYTVMYAVSGRIIDFFGTRRGLAVFVLGWSAIDAAQAAARSLLQFSVGRFLLGATEAANFPAAVKAVSEWFPVRERALAVGVFNSGTAIGAAVAAPIVAWVTLHYGWRETFLVGSISSAVWAVAWACAYRTPKRTEAAEETRARRVPIKRLLGLREVWGCIAARTLTDPISYLFAFWIPRYLQDARGFDLAMLGKLYWAPYMGLLLGNLASGAIPGALIRVLGWSLNRARKTVMFAASIVMAAAFMGITRVPNPLWALALIGIAMFCHAAWANMTLPAEVFEPEVIGSITGFAGACGSLVSAVAMLAIGHAVVHSYTPVFAVYAALPMTAFIVVCFCIRQLGSIRELPELA